jgi:NAD(P)-dependent dehydrogenase (short-subunit alcohol dehydrogenase family)
VSYVLIKFVILNSQFLIYFPARFWLDFAPPFGDHCDPGLQIMSENRKKRVLITGCSSGFGLSTAVSAARAGYDVVATMRNLDKAHYLEDALKNARATASIDRLDVTSPDDISQIALKYAPIDILVNNAGILIMGSFLDITEEETRRVIETNYFGAVALTRAIVPQMIEAGSGRIINIASLAGLVGHIFNAAYSAGKHALVGFSRSIRLELKPFNIDVVSVEPGYHKTEIIRANANVSENFYDRNSPMFQYNRGFLRLMRDEIIPRAADPDAVVKHIVDIMGAKHPKPHYVIGKDAFFTTTAAWLGLTSLLEKKVCNKLLSATRRENRRADAKRSKRKNKPNSC